MTKKQSLNEIERFYQKIQEIKSTTVDLDPDLPIFPMVIIGTKVNLKDYLIQ